MVPGHSFFFDRELPSGLVCFTAGTDFAKVKSTTAASPGDRCPCRPNYFGADCGIPEAAWFGHYKVGKGNLPLIRDIVGLFIHWLSCLVQGRSTARAKLRRRKKLRRIVHATLANHELDFFEARVRSLADVVDAFVVQESNFTTFGSPKPLQFLSRFRQGWLWEHQVSERPPDHASS